MEYVLLAVIVTIPLINIFRRAGLNPALGFTGLIPVFGLFIALGMLALMDWPDEPAGYR